MEFSYRVSEADYRSAWKLRQKAFRRPTFRLVMFWVFVLVCLLMLWTVVQKSANLPDRPQNAVVTQEEPSQPKSQGSSAESLLANVGFFILFLGVWVYLVALRVPRQLRRAYQKDPVMQGQFTVSIEPASITLRNTAGTLFQAGWNVYESWGQRQEVVVLFLRNGTASILNLAGLTDYQRNELRSILTAALPQK